MRRRPAIRRAICIPFLAALFAIAVPSFAQANAYRSLSGTVTDEHHEPLKGAVVEVQNEGDKSVISFLTDRAGHYDFKRLNSNTDFTFWATYRSHRSKTHSISKFDSKMSPVVDLEIKLE